MGWQDRGPGWDWERSDSPPASEPTVRSAVEALGWTQMRTARELGAPYREFRYWFVGKKEAPRAIILALMQLMREYLT